MCMPSIELRASCHMQLNLQTYNITCVVAGYTHSLVASLHHKHVRRGRRGRAGVGGGLPVATLVMAKGGTAAC